MAGTHRNSAAIVRGDRISSHILSKVCTEGSVQNTAHAVYKTQITAEVNQGVPRDCLRTGVRAATVTRLRTVI